MRTRIVAGVAAAVVVALLPTRVTGAPAADQPGGPEQAAYAAPAQHEDHEVQEGHEGHEDHEVQVTTSGVEFFLDPMPTPPPGGYPDPTQPLARTSARAVAPLSETFALHSLPTSPRKLYLDFDGYTVPAGGDWSGVAAGAVTGINTEGSPSTFTATERTRIQEIWRVTAAKFAPFNLDVTTQDPGPAALTRTSAADTTYGIRVIITDDPRPQSQIPGCGGCAGVAALGAFTELASEKVGQAWVFSFGETSGNVPITANVAAHEAGHTFNLEHDGTTGLLGVGGSEYYSGHANWLPIMGISTNGRALAQFDRGEYSSASERQDDLATIAANGAPLRGDDHPSTRAAARPLPVAGSYQRSGIIGTAADVDVFRINRTCTGTLRAAATGIGLGATLDASVRILSSTGSQLAFADPVSGQSTASGDAVPTGVDAVASVANAPRGTYYVEVDGVGSGNPANTGYSDYGSVGQYALSITGCPNSPPSAARIGTASSGAPGGARTATIRWSAPSSTGGAPVTSYRVIAYAVKANGSRVKVRTSSARTPRSRAYTWALPAGRYAFTVVARNKFGNATASAFSTTVRSR